MIHPHRRSLSPQAMQEAQERYGHFSTFMVHSDALYQEIAILLETKGRGHASPTTGRCFTFLDLFEAELSRIADYIFGQHDSQERSVKALLANAFTHFESDASHSRATAPDLLQGLQNQANEQLQNSLMLRRFAKKNIEILQEVAKYADTQLATTCTILLQHQLRRFPDADSPLTVLFSDIFATLRAAADAGTTKIDSEQWVAPLSFERVTTKYWVAEEDLAEVLLLASAEAPLLVYGRNGRLTSKADCVQRRTGGSSTNKLWESLVTPISSVYFDSTDLGLYGSRIVREEGSQLLRARWYGAKPEGKSPIFLELKTHHEKWINSKSVKERVVIQAQHMDSFLSPKAWTNDDAMALVIAATPKLTGIDLEKTTALLLTMHEMVIKLALRPCVRSVYKRAAFQSSKSNALRLTVDRGIVLIDETLATPSDGSWCLTDSDIATAPATVARQVPFAVFEVKLSSSDTPASIHTMEDEEIIVLATKFSKFLTGVASFHASQLDKLPYWADYPAFSSLFFQSNPTNTMNSDYSERSITSTKESDETSPCPRHADGYCKIGHSGSAKEASSLKKQPKMNVPFQHNTLAKKGGNTLRIVPKTPVRVEPKSYFANERTFIQWISGALLLVTVAAIILDRQTEKSAKIYVGLTLVVCSSVIVCYATFVYFRRLKLLASGSPYGYVDRIGPMILSCSVLVGVGVLTFYYFDRAGILGGLWSRRTLTSQPGVCIPHHLQGVALLEYQPSDVIVDPFGDSLLVPSLSQITGLSKELVRGKAPEVLATIPGVDLECLTYVGDRLFAVSEGPRTSLLIELAWNNGVLQQVQALTLESANVEGIAFIPDGGSESEGKLYVAGNNRVTSPTGETHNAVIDIYQVPSRQVEGNNETVLSRGRLNNNLLNQGLVDSKISALNYFEGVLYILHDNAQVIRAWDVREAKLLAEMKLPAVKGGFDQQWEGLTLERRNVENANGLRGSSAPSSSLFLHLTLDSPPQVWSLMVREGATNGSLILPNCAV